MYLSLRKQYELISALVSKVRGDGLPKKSLAFTAIESKYLRRCWAFRTDIPRNEQLTAPVTTSHDEDTASAEIVSYFERVST